MPDQKPLLRTAAIVVAAVVAVATPIVQALTGTLGVGEGSLASDGDTTLRAAAYAFSIWTPIYGGLLVYAAYQALPSTGNSPGLRLLGWPSMLAMSGCASWLVAASFDAKWATVIIIVLSALVLSIPLAKRFPVQHRVDFWLVCLPISLLAGWLTIAAAINALTVLTSQGVIDAAGAPIWATGEIMLVAITGLALTAGSKNWIYPLPIAWGFVSVAVAEQADRPMISLLAILAALALLATAGWVGTHRSLLLPLPREH